MGFFSRILRRISGSAAAPAASGGKAPNTQPPVLNPWLTTTPIFPVGDYFVFSQQGYLRNELVYRGVNMLAGAIAEAPLRVYSRGGEPLEDHPLRALVKRPNPFMGEHLLWEMTVIHLYLSGNAFWVKVRSGSGRVAEVWPLRPDRLRIVPDNRKFVAGYIYEIGGRQYPLDPNDVVHFKFPHPIYDYWGLSPLQAALRRIVIDNETADFTKVLLQNNATPSIAVTTQNAIDQATADRLSSRWREKFGGRNRGVPAFLQAGMDIKTIGLSMKDLAFPELDASSQRRVLVALGVPPVLLGQEATFSNYEQARVSFYEDTVEPLQSRLDDRLESDLLYADFDASFDLELKFDISKVSALRPVRKLKWENAQAGVAGGFLTVNRALAMVGEPPAADGDVYLRPLSTAAVPEKISNPNPHLAGENGGKSAAAAFFPLPFREGGQGVRLGLRDLSPGPSPKGEGKLNLPRCPSPERDGSQDPLAALRDWARAEFKYQARDVIRAVAMDRKALTRGQVAQIAEEIAALSSDWTARAASNAVPVIADLIATGGGVRAETAGDRAASFVIERARALGGEISTASAAAVNAILSEARNGSLSISETIERFEAEFQRWYTARAEEVARTEAERAGNPRIDAEADR